MEVSPQSSIERAFAVIVVLFAFVVSAGFISSITTSMTRLELLAETQQGQFVALRRYLSLNGISGKLAARVQRNAQYAVQERTLNIAEEEVELLQLVSDPLRMELHYEIYSPVLTCHPLLRKYNEAGPAAFRRLCHTAVSIVVLHDRDVLFTNHEVPQVAQMYFLVAGTMQYLKDDYEPRVVSPHDWLCEGMLWTSWYHMGLLRAISDVRLLALDGLLFQMTAHQFRSRSFRPQDYAKKFVELLNENYMDGDLDDLADERMPWEALLSAAFPKDEGQADEDNSKFLTNIARGARRVSRMTNSMITRHDSGLSAGKSDKSAGKSDKSP